MTLLSSLYGKGLVSDVAYPTGWNGETGISPSKNAVYDEMELRIKATSTITDNRLTRGDGGSRGVQESTIIVDDSGRMTNPSQPCFLVRPAVAQENIVVESEVTIIFGTEIFDQGNNFTSNTFTAPITGRYQLNSKIRANNLDNASTHYLVDLITSNNTYRVGLVRSDEYAADLAYWIFSSAVIVDMDVNDTAYLIIYQDGGSQQSDVLEHSYFSGALIC